MSQTARLITRVIVATVLALIVGTIMVFSYTGVMEPLSVAFSGVPPSLDWGTPISDVMGMTAAGMLALLLVLVLWFILAPIRQDKRQQFRRP